MGSTVALFGAAPKPKPAHPIADPPALKLTKIVVEDPILYGRPTPAVVAVPRDLTPGERLPLAVLLPGGEHTMQKRDEGCWGWWSDFALGDAVSALKRGNLTKDDLRGFATDAQVSALNGRLPYRDMILVTPFILRRQTELGPHGVMNLKFIRALVERVRKDFPVLPERAGLAGVSAGGLWALWLGFQLDDLFSSIVAVQPYTDGYEKTLDKMLAARKQPQSIRMITSTGDHLHAPAKAWAEKHKLPIESYAGPHEPIFAKGPGAIETLLTLDHELPRPKPSAPVASTTVPTPAPSTPPPPPPPAPTTYRAPRSHLWPFIGAAAVAGTATAFLLARMRKRL
jgi:hypothetical protein